MLSCPGRGAVPAAGTQSPGAASSWPSLEWRMETQRTFAIIKPNAVQRGQVGQIISAIEENGLALRGMRMARLTPEICREFYQEHVTKGFYPLLEAFMTEGP